MHGLVAIFIFTLVLLPVGLPALRSLLNFVRQARQLRRSGAIPLDARRESVPVEALPDAVRAALSGLAPALVAAGFTAAAYVRKTGPADEVLSYSALWLNRAAGDMGTIIFLPSAAAGFTQNIAFDTHLRDGRVFVTAGDYAPPLWRRPGERVLHCLLHHDDPQMLYSIHRAWLAAAQVPPGEPVVPPPAEVLSVLRQEMAGWVGRGMARGDLVIDADGRTARFTRRGAVRVALACRARRTRAALRRDQQIIRTLGRRGPQSPAPAFAVVCPAAGTAGPRPVRPLDDDTTRADPSPAPGPPPAG